MVMRTVPRGPATALLAQPADIVMAEEEISVTFVEVSYLCAVAGNAPKQGPKDRFVHFGEGRKNDAKWVYKRRVEDRQPKHLALRPPRNAADDSGHHFFAHTINALDFNDLAGE
jgi:hypothetical protein